MLYSVEALCRAVGQQMQLSYCSLDDMTLETLTGVINFIGWLLVLDDEREKVDARMHQLLKGLSVIIEGAGDRVDRRGPNHFPPNWVPSACNLIAVVDF